MVESPALGELMQSSSLPTIPAVAVQILALVQRPDLDIEDLSETISRDPALSARVLKTANSGFYGRPRSVKRVRDAVMVLGLRSVKTLALGFSLVADMKKQRGCSGMDHAAVWQRSLLTATAARSIAVRAGLNCSDEAFLAGLLHLIGVVALDQVLGPRYAAAVASAELDFARMRTLERDRFGFDHAEAGAALAELWNLPEALVTAIRSQATPDNAPQEQRELVRCVAAASTAADLALGSEPGAALTRFRWDCAQLFGIPADDADALVESFLEDARTLGAMLDVPDAGGSAQEVMARAREALLQMMLETERENLHLQAERERLEVEASSDPLTGLANRRHLDEFLGEQFRISARYGTPLSVLMVDIDHFKKVNDEHGHPVGDQVLREVARAMRASVRDADLCARYGGEEFLVVLPATGIEGARETAERLLQEVRTLAIVASGTRISVTVSAGISAYRSAERPSAEWLVKEADLALYEAKRLGRDQVRVHGEEAAASPWSLVS